jgi:tetratricopeptide (TPR) repeat protein
VTHAHRVLHLKRPGWWLRPAIGETPLPGRPARAPASRVGAAAALLVVLGVLAYSNALTNPFSGIDTLQAVRDNPDIRSLTPLARALSLHRIGASAANDNSTLVRRPILSLSFAVNYAALGPAPWGFQAGNIVIHTAAALLLFGIARRSLIITAFADRGRACWLAFSIAALWLVHPLQTESVTNIVQRAESLMGFFAFLTLYCAIHAWQSNTRGRGRAWSAAAVLACALGMGTKEIMVVVPLLVWLYDALFVCSGFAEPLGRRPRFYCALAATWLVPALLVALTLENTAREFQPARLGSYLLSQPRVVMHYLRLVFWPHPLFAYIVGQPFWFHPGVDSWVRFLLYAAPLGVLIGATVAALLRRHPAALLGAAFFLPLAPTSLVATFTLIQEHRVYLSLAAALGAIVLATDTLIVRLLPGARRAPRAVLLVVTLTGLLYATRLRNQDYRSDLTLWAPDDLPLAFTMRSGLALYHSNLSEAADVLETLRVAAEQSHPGDPLFAYHVRATSGLATVRTLEARLDDARALFAQALAQDPSYAAAENNLAVACALSGDGTAARRHLQAALALDPQQAATHFNYAIVSLMDGNRAVAEEHLARADELLPAPARLGETRRRALLEIDPTHVRLEALLSPSDQEFSMDYRLALTVAPDH